VKAVIIPISSDESVLQDKLAPAADGLAREIDSILGGAFAHVDRQYHMRPGDRFFCHIQRGVPIRIELGEKEYGAGSATIVRRDTSERERVSLPEAAGRVKELLGEIQNCLHDRARDFRDANTHDVSSMGELKEFFKEGGKGGFARVYFGGSAEDEGEIKHATGGATIRCMPIEDETRGKCVYTGKPDARRAVIAKSY
jgi:prolyl-tRNA synthetase